MRSSTVNQEYDSGGARGEKNSRSKTAKRLFEIIENVVSAYLTALIIAGLSISMCIEVVQRWIFNRSFVGLPEVLEIIAVVITFTALSTVQRSDAHVAMRTILDKLMQGRAGPIICFINALGVFALFIFISFVLSVFTYQAYKVGHTTTNIFMPIWPGFFIATMGSILMIIRVGIQMKGALMLMKKKAETGYHDKDKDVLAMA